MGDLKIFTTLFIGGGIGSVLRYSISLLVVNNFKSYLPLATFLANMLAIAIMGIALAYAEPKFEQYPWLRGMVLVGFCGGLSTFSTFSYETVFLLKGYHWIYAVGNVLLSVIIGGLILYPFVKILK